MPMVIKTAQFSRTRILISGFTMSGKTYSLHSFIYGPYDYFDPDEHADALAYAAEQGKHMVVLTCPGEIGARTLQAANDYITPYFFETAPDEVMATWEWSRHALDEYRQVEKEVVRNKPDFLVHDGIHGLALHQLNDITKGELLGNIDMNINPDTGKKDPYRKANFYDTLANTFGQTMAAMYSTNVPVIVCTCWEDWKGQQSDSERARGIEAKRYLWPDIPGKMATRVAGMLDARISARLEDTCIHEDCVDRREGNKHYVWQFAPAGDVLGVGIKGLNVRRRWVATPYIHQKWDVLRQLMTV